MNDGLSREQVEALRVLLRRAARGHLGLNEGDYWPSGIPEAQAAAIAESDWIAAMLAEARAEVVRDVEALCDEAEAGHGPMQSKPSGYVPTVLVRRALARHMPAAVREGSTERLPASRDSGGPPERERPSDGHTGPRALDEAEHLAAIAKSYADEIRDQDGDDPTCGEALGDMRCQLRRGHDGDHEDWSQA